MRAIILAGGPSGRQAGIPEGLPRPFWPLVMRPLVSRLIDHLATTGVRGVSVCANGHTNLFSMQLESERLTLGELRFTQDPLPRGPAGCIKDNEEFLREAPFLIFGAACWLRDPVESLIERHCKQNNKLTVFCLPNSRTPSGVYACDPEVIQFIPAVGYCDIKEQLVPRILGQGLRVGALPLREPAAEVVSARSYLLLHHKVLATLAEEEQIHHPNQYDRLGHEAWIARSASVSPTARLIGPVIVGPQSVIADHAVIIGPTAIGPRVIVDQDAIVTESVIWEGVRLSRGQNVSRTVIATTAQPPSNQLSEMPRPQQVSVTHQEIRAYA